MAKYTCLICNTEFMRRGKKIAKYCSFKCYYKSKEGVKRPPDVCKKISQNHARLFLGKHHTDETKEKISKNRSGKHTGKDHHSYNGGITQGLEQTCIFCGKKYIAKSWSRKYCSHECYSSNCEGRHLSYSGYIMILKWEHPFKDKHGYVPEHRLIVEGILKRYLTKKETIHHIDENRSNNHPSNLYLFNSRGEHTSYHNLSRYNPYIKITKSNLID